MKKHFTPRYVGLELAQCLTIGTQQAEALQKENYQLLVIGCWILNGGPWPLDAVRPEIWENMYCWCVSAMMLVQANVRKLAFRTLTGATSCAPQSGAAVHLSSIPHSC